MPIYLCQPGTSSKEPWRHGVQVYERPFPLHDPASDAPAQASGEEGGGGAIVKDGPRQIVAMANPAQKCAALQRHLTEVGLQSSTTSTEEGRAVMFCSGQDRGTYLCDGWAAGLRREGFSAVAVHNGAGGTDARDDVRKFLGTARGVLVADDGVEDIVREELGSQKVRLVVNFDLVGMDMETYVRRLSYASDAVVSLFHAGEDAPLARELVSTLREYGQNVPEELAALVPPALLTPPKLRTRSMAARAGEDDTDSHDPSAEAAARGRPARGVVPLREESRSPGPDEGSGGGGSGGEDDAQRTRRLQRQFRQNRDGTTSHSSLEEETAHASGGTAVHARGGRFPFVPAGRGPGPSAVPHPVRRVRHAEVVLVDRCVVAYGRTWLRLRWPGEHGGFGGFVALSKVDEKVKAGYYKVAEEEGEAGTTKQKKNGDDGPAPEEGAMFCAEVGASGSRPPPPTTMMAASSATQTALLCKETNVYYPTSGAMKLLPLYDDGLSSGGEGTEEATPLGLGEPVFCRICREGLHDVNYDLEKATDGEPATSSSSRGGRAEGNPSAGGNESEGSASAGNNSDTLGSDSSSSTSQPMQPREEAANPPLVLHHPTAENPLLAPCDCTGTMAFVHYLCVEQWRCRSRHPGARGGLNCETCGAEYTLPPPPSRPAGRHDVMGGGPGGNVMAEDDWLDAMPPHVLAALRRPHPAWQLGAAVVRRRWLRPVVPVLISPLVALYCRARRTLKKRGVSRRRWACSLCRRRARWKCVRCLRSYYCSRQCQNVSWHIVHKHVCYKPVRFWWSVVVYSVGICLAVPGLMENFPIYDAMVTLLPVNFIALGIIFGGIASTLKRSSGVDIRGRILEVVVVTLTMLLTAISSGLVRGFFGDVSQCWGMFAPEVGEAGAEDPAAAKGPFYPPSLNTVLVDIPLRQIQLWYMKWDMILSRLGFVSRRFICAPTPDGSTDYSVVGCSPSARNINPQFYLEEGEGRCSGQGAPTEGSATDALFEWLTNFRSLRHLVLPSRIVGDGSPSLAFSDASDGVASSPARVRLTALHVGCGTSTVGESLLRLRERAGDRVLQYGRVVNVDNDGRALDSMRRRWEELRRSEDDASPPDRMGEMMWKHLDFKSDASCRSALDGVYCQLTHDALGASTQPGGCFDLVLDKSTLDCLLCAETSVVAQFLCEVYRALRAPSPSSSDHDDDATATATWGGVYVLATFHPVEFVERLLTELPGSDWHVEHEVIRREVENVNGKGSCAVDEATNEPNAPFSGADIDTLPPSSSAWSSGTFNPDENYRRTVTVFTCRRRCSQLHCSEGEASQRPSYILDRALVQQHIEIVCDEWYQTTNPMITPEREEKLRDAFLEAAAAKASIDDDACGNHSESNDVVLDLKKCYDILFTEAEKEHLTYEFFLEDWAAYCERSKEDGGSSIRGNGMTVDVALDFLKEMQ